LITRPYKAGYVEKIWDHAAGVIIVEEAGGVVSDAAGPNTLPAWTQAS